MKIIVASQNPVKRAATHQGFTEIFPDQDLEIASVSVDSCVPDQPWSEDQTLEGAMKRALGAQKQISDADFWIGIEGGVKKEAGEIHAFAWVYIKSNDNKIGKGRTGTFILPPAVAKLLKEGKELGEADDIVFQRKNSKQENGAVGILTQDAIDRTEYYKAAVIFALIPFKNPNLYQVTSASLH